MSDNVDESQPAGVEEGDPVTTTAGGIAAVAPQPQPQPVGVQEGDPVATIADGIAAVTLQPQPAGVQEGDPVVTTAGDVRIYTQTSQATATPPMIATSFMPIFLLLIFSYSFCLVSFIFLFLKP